MYLCMGGDREWSGPEGMWAARRGYAMAGCRLCRYCLGQCRACGYSVLPLQRVQIHSNGRVLGTGQVTVWT
jgi:hypothetical protein